MIGSLAYKMNWEYHMIYLLLYASEFYCLIYHIGFETLVISDMVNKGAIVDLCYLW